MNREKLRCRGERGLKKGSIKALLRLYQSAINAVLRYHAAVNREKLRCRGERGLKKGSAITASSILQFTPTTSAAAAAAALVQPLPLAERAK